MEHFDWRLSIAQVVENGPFSDFSGYERSLFLLEGNGIDLAYNRTTSDSLIALLDVARFDGGDATVATLRSGPISDFNLMSRKGKYTVRTETIREQGHVDLVGTDHAFVFSPRHEASLSAGRDQAAVLVPAGHLLVLDGGEGAGRRLEGTEAIVIELNERSS